MKKLSLYGYRWRRVREWFLRRNPLCVQCMVEGRTTAANVVDHILRHTGHSDPRFWNVANLQPLCKRCHDSVKQQRDIKGYACGHGVDGWPLEERR